MTLQERAEDLFVEVAELPQSERERLLDEHCGTDAQLRQAVERLLEANGSIERRLGALAGRLGLGEEPTGASAVAGRQIGHYRLVRLIGRGGMGAVYLAERADAAFEHRVALKVLPLGFQSPIARARFLAERQILARLNHPGIAHLLDGGIEDDTPYFVMEYVEGTPIDEYCDEHRLNIDARLALFLQVCAAVDYAHRNLVIHRDLKPGNVLVTTTGEVKLLDFGIAKLLDEHSPQLTRAGMQPMTIRYASPEALLGEPVSTASDVYSLGVLLYELLTGICPYGELESTSPMALVQQVLKFEVPAASNAHARVASDSSRKAIEWAELRDTTPEKLFRRLRGDLDTIVAAALNPDPTVRYDTAARLAADIRRSADDLPITARIPTLGYTLRKLVSRHTTLVVAGCVSILSLVVVALLATYYGIATAKQSEQIAQERDRAQQIQGYLLSVFGASDPNQSLGASVTAKELLDRGAETIERELAGQPESQALMNATIGNLYVVLGLYTDARPLLERAVELYAASPGRHSDEYSSALDQLIELFEIEGEYAQALVLAEEAYTLGLAGSNREATARGAMRVGRIEHLMGRLGPAEEHYRASLVGLRELFGEDHPLVARNLGHLGGLLEHLGRLEEAESLLRRALEINLANHGDEHLATIEALISLGSVLTTLGRPQDALEVLNKAFRLNARLLGPDHRDSAFIHNHRANAYLSLDDHAAAEAEYRSALVIVAAHFGVSHPNYGIVLGNVGKTLMDRGAFSEAEPVLRDASVQLLEALPDHWIPYDLQRRLGVTLTHLQRYAEAEDALLSSVEGLQARAGSESTAARMAVDDLVHLMELQHRQADATAYRQRFEAGGELRESL